MHSQFPIGFMDAIILADDGILTFFRSKISLDTKGNSDNLLSINNTPLEDFPFPVILLSSSKSRSIKQPSSSPYPIVLKLEFELAVHAVIILVLVLSLDTCNSVLLVLI